MNFRKKLFDHFLNPSVTWQSKELSRYMSISHRRLDWACFVFFLPTVWERACATKFWYVDLALGHCLYLEIAVDLVLARSRRQWVLESPFLFQFVLSAASCLPRAAHAATRHCWCHCQLLSASASLTCQRRLALVALEVLWGCLLRLLARTRSRYDHSESGGCDQFPSHMSKVCHTEWPESFLREL